MVHIKVESLMTLSSYSTLNLIVNAASIEFLVSSTFPAISPPFIVSISLSYLYGLSTI